MAGLLSSLQDEEKTATTLTADGGSERTGPRTSPSRMISAMRSGMETMQGITSQLREQSQTQGPEPSTLPDVGASTPGGDTTETPTQPDPPTAASPKLDMPQEASVRYQLDDMLSEDSPLMQRAATQGQQFANQRGLLNSSMAADASMGAMIDRAAPIAAQEAGNQLQWQARERGFEQDQIMMQLDEGMRERLMGIQHDYQMQLQNNQLAAGLWNQAIQSMGLALNNPDMTPAQQQRAVEMIAENMGRGLDFMNAMGWDFGSGGGDWTGGDWTGGGTGGDGSADSGFNFDAATETLLNQHPDMIPLREPGDVTNFLEGAVSDFNKLADPSSNQSKKFIDNIYEAFGPDGLGLDIGSPPNLKKASSLKDTARYFQRYEKAHEWLGDLYNTWLRSISA